MDAIAFITCLSYGIATKQATKGAYLFIELFFLPNIVMLLMVMFNDSFSSRYMYQRWLRFKLVVQAFALPIIVLTYDESFWEAHVCSKFKFDMTQTELQAIIDKKDFTLLVGDDGKFNGGEATNGIGLGVTRLDQPKHKQTLEERKDMITEMQNQIGNALSVV